MENQTEDYMGNQVGNYKKNHRGATRKARLARPDRMARHVQRVLVHYYIMFVLIRGIPFHSIPRSMFYSQPICMGACQHRPHLQLHLVWDLYWYTSFLGCVKLWYSHSLGFTLAAIGFIVQIELSHLQQVYCGVIPVHALQYTQV